MFVVGTVQRVADATDPTKFELVWPVVLEDAEQGFVGGTVATRESRDEAQKLADALNAQLPPTPAPPAPQAHAKR